MHKQALIVLTVLGFTFTFAIPPMLLAQNMTSVTEEGDALTQSKKNDFDFLIGEWHVQNKRLKTPFADSNEWVEFPAKLEGSRKLLNGLLIMEQFKAELNGKYFEGISLRVFSPTTMQWTIYWVDTGSAQLKEQVIGTFKDDTGEFYGYGKELFRDKLVKMRFIWSDITTKSARWEQAYFDDKRGAWETNWIMEFTRVGE